MRKDRWPSAFIRVKVEVELQQFCILQEFPQSGEDRNLHCLGSPPVAEILGETRKFLLDILKVSETTVWASSRAAAGRAGILWRDVIEQPSVLKGSKRKLRLDQRIYGFLRGEEVRQVAGPKTDKSSVAKKVCTCYLDLLSIICSPVIKDYILSEADSSHEMLLPEVHRLTKWNIHLPLTITQ